MPKLFAHVKCRESGYPVSYKIKVIMDLFTCTNYWCVCTNIETLLSIQTRVHWKRRKEARGCLLVRQNC